MLPGTHPLLRAAAPYRSKKDKKFSGASVIPCMPRDVYRKKRKGVHVSVGRGRKVMKRVIL